MGLLAKMADRSADLVEQAAEAVGTALEHAVDAAHANDSHTVKSLIDGGKQAVSRAADTSVHAAGDAVETAGELLVRAGDILGKAAENTKGRATDLLDSTGEALMRPRRASRKTALVIGFAVVAVGVGVGAALWHKKRAAAGAEQAEEESEALDLGDLSDLDDDSQASQDSIAEAEAEAEEADEAAGGEPTDLEREE